MLGLLPLATLLLSLSPLAAAGDAVHLRPDWNGRFETRGAQGVFALYSLREGSWSTNDEARARRRFSPASTFKIPNAVVAIDTGVVRDERQVFAWDGSPRAMATWRRDHTLRTAMKYSVVPVFQAIARQVGEARMQEYVTGFAYGNADIGGGIDRFWLDGKLAISPVEQIEFLRKLYDNALPASERSQRIVKDILVCEATPDCVVRAKTGYSGSREPRIGWWVGWVERDDNVYFFAMNLDITDPGRLDDRIAISKDILRAEGVLTGETAQPLPGVRHSGSQAEPRARTE